MKERSQLCGGWEEVEGERRDHWQTEGNQEEVAQDDISVTEKSVAEVVFILLDRYDRNLTEVTDSRQCQPC